jgi:hypothetical protein
MGDERLHILKMLETGQIATDEALQLLDALNQTQASNEAPTAPEYAPAPADVPQKGNWWLVPTVTGAVVMAIGAPLLALGLSGQAPVVWAMCCGWIPFLVGLAILAIGVWSRSARWLHLRIDNSRTGKRTFALSMPLPLTLAAWIMKLVRPFVPQTQDVAIDEMILALRDAWREGEDEPLYIEVQDDDDEEHVRIFIG